MHLFDLSSRRGSSRPVQELSWARAVVAVFLAAGLGACASLSQGLGAHGGGEQVTYRVWNDTGRAQIERPTLTAVDDGTLLYTNLRARAPGSRWSSATVTGQIVAGPQRPSDTAGDLLALPRRFEGAFSPAPAGHRVPREGRIQWREPATPGQAIYRGSRQPSLVVPLRSAIPRSVLAQVAQGWRYRLDIAVGAHTEQPSVHWRLMRHGDDGFYEVRRSRGW